MILDLIKSLLDAKSDIDARDQNQRTALHHLIDAASGDYEALTEVEELLLSCGADPFVVDASSRMPIHYAFVKIGQ